MGSFRKDDRVAHAQYGAGIVIEAGERYTIVAFDDGALRKFVTSLVKLERSTLPPPVRPATVPRRGREAARAAAARRNGR